MSMFAKRAELLGIGIASEAPAAPEPPEVEADAPELPDDEAGDAEAYGLIVHAGILLGGLAGLKRRVAAMTEDDF